jgi:hypothetical protein
LTARFAALRIRIADGTPQRIFDKGQQHMPGEEAWLGPVDKVASQIS